MDDNSQLFLLIQTQQKMGEDIADIKASIKEAAQILIFLRRDQDELKAELKKRIEQLEKQHQECPARLKMQGWSIGLRDYFWLISTIAGTISLWYLFKQR